MITPKEIEVYCEAHSSPSPAIFSALDSETRSHAPGAWHMQVGSLEGRFLSLFARGIGAVRVLEFGTFTGCSTLHVALSLPENGRITTLDRDPAALSIAKKFWEQAGVTHKVESLLGDATASSERLEKEIRSGTRPHFDFAFIDADKGAYPAYFERALACVKKGGWILVDNVLWSGRVLNPRDPSDHALHTFNELRKSDQRVEQVILPIRDGIMLCRVL